ncbi:MAG TPA: PAS domain S-box protein [Methanospirillum sp.]|nr:PAS domain S-box protein [Methanospirillum sp.]
MGDPGIIDQGDRLTPISVLYVDDEPSLLDIARIFLERGGGMKITTALSGSEAIKLLKTYQPDIIVSDYHMPDMNGIELLKYLHPRCNNIPFILFTGRGREEVVIEAINNGATFYLQKGGDPRSQFAELAHKIKQAVRQRNAEQELRESRNRFANFFNLPLIGITMITPDGEWIEVNDRTCDLLGYSRDELNSLTWKDLTVPEDFEREMMLYEEIVTGIRASYTLRKRCIRKDGSLISTEISAMPVRSEDGTIEYIIAIIQDISEQVRMEGEIVESTRRYRELADLLPLPVFEADSRGMLTFVNQNALTTFQYTLQDLIQGLSYLIMITPEHREKAATTLKNRLSGKISHIGSEYLFVRRDGTQFPGVIYTSPIYQEGEITGLRGVIVDITELKQQEESFSKVFYHNPSLMAISSLRSGLFIDVNRSFEEHTGYPRDMVIGRSPAELHLFVSQTQRDAMLMDIMKGVRLKDFEADIRTRTGEIRTLLFSGEVLIVGDEMLLFSQAIDTTDRKSVDKALRESEDRLRTLINAMPDIVCFKDGQGRWLVANPFDIELFKLTGVDYQGKTDSDLADFSPFYQEAFLACKDSDEKTWQAGKAMRGIEVIPRPEERDLIFDIIKVPTYHDDGSRKGLVVIGRDITELRDAQNESALAISKLNLLSTITRHDILNSLTGLLGYLELASLSTTFEEINGYLTKCTLSTHAIRHQIEFTRDYQNLGVKNPVWHVAAGLFRSVLDMLEVKEIQVDSDLDTLYVYADPLLEKVVYNLIDNALRYGGKISTIKSWFHHSEVGVIWVIADDGIGIEDGMKERIFTKGFGRNTGLGLFLAREILAITGISIKEVGIYGKGARFELIIPEGHFKISPSDHTAP